jgi:hypothetical protein
MNLPYGIPRIPVVHGDTKSLSIPISAPYRYTERECEYRVASEASRSPIAYNALQL